MDNTTAPQQLNPIRAALFMAISIALWMAFELVTNVSHPSGFVTAIVMGASSEVAAASLERRRHAR